MSERDVVTVVLGLLAVPFALVLACFVWVAFTLLLERLGLGWLALAFAAVIVAGCADLHWAKPGATYDDFVRDSRSCEQDAMRYYGAYASFAPYVGFRYQDQHVEVNKDMYRACLKARGYVRVEDGPWVGVRD